MDFAEPADRASAERKLYEGAAPLAVEWAEGDRALTLTYHIKDGERVLIHTRRNKQVPADVLVGEQVYWGVTLLPTWPKERGGHPLLAPL